VVEAQSSSNVTDCACGEIERPENWKELSPPFGRFSIAMPGVPAREERETQAADRKLFFIKYTLQSGMVVFYVTYGDLGINGTGADSMLDASRIQIFSQTTLRLVSEKEIALDNYRGREWLAQSPLGIFLWHSYIVSGRLYQIALFMPTSMASRTARLSADANDQTDLFRRVSSKFFDSFRLTEGEVDRLLREIREDKKDVTVLYVANDSAAHPAGTVSAKAVRLVQPVYPPIARQAHASGSVSVQVVIGVDGQVVAAQIAEGHPLLRAASIAA